MRFDSSVALGGILAVGNTLITGTSPQAVGRNFRLPASSMFSIQV